MRFRDRRAAGRELATRLMEYTDQPGVVVLALPRGGVPVGYEVALALHAPLDVFLVRKLGTPGQEELAMGAIASGGIRVLNPDVVEGLAISEHVIDQIAAAEGLELARRAQVYRDDRPAVQVADRTVILVDDGLATGATMRAALIALRQEQPRRLVAAVPVAPESTCWALGAITDEAVCLETPEPFYGVGIWYDDFAPTSDDEVRELLRRSTERPATPPRHPPEPPEPHATP
ncbi:MAG TPA: phosphoribosyltransferase [Ktedonobacterales bacterium]|nr:phosphoribosyltransferase [Ktedonobacterales bacterium]